MSTYVKVPDTYGDVHGANAFLRPYGYALVPVSRGLVADWASYPMSGQRWTTDQDERLLSLYFVGNSLTEICKMTGRPPGGIISRLNKRGLIEYRKSRRYVTGYYRNVDNTMFASYQEYLLLHRGN